jgi:hypothetical protein
MTGTRAAFLAGLCASEHEGETETETEQSRQSWQIMLLRISTQIDLFALERWWPITYLYGIS